MFSISFYFARKKARSWIQGSNFFRLCKQKRIITVKKTIPCLFQKATVSRYIMKVWDGALVEQGTELDIFPWNMLQPENYSIRWKGVFTDYDTNKRYLLLRCCIIWCSWWSYNDKYIISSVRDAFDAKKSQSYGLCPNGGGMLFLISQKLEQKLFALGRCWHPELTPTSMSRHIGRC